MAEAVVGVEPGASLEPAMRAAAERFLAGLGAERLAAFGGNEEAVVDRLVQAIGQPQSQFSLRFDPRPALQSADVPVLALYGGKDRQIDAAGAAEAWRNAEADTGAPAEYGTIEQTISSTALEAIAGWLQSNPAGDRE